MKVSILKLCFFSILFIPLSLSAQILIANTINGETANDSAGFAVAISGNGNRVAIGSTQNDENGLNAGQVRVYDLVAGNWIQLGNDLNGLAAGDNFGFSIALSQAGDRMIIGSPYSNSETGHAQIFEYNGTDWIQMGNQLDGEVIGGNVALGVSISNNGNRVAIGERRHDVNGVQSGQARIYEWNGSAWLQLGSNLNGLNAGDRFGYSADLSADGNRLVVGAARNDNNGVAAGQVRVYEYNGTDWVQVGSPINGENPNDRCGVSAISADGNRVAIAAWNYDPVSLLNAGHIRVFDYNGTDWQQVGNSIEGEIAEGGLGYFVDISADGTRVIGAAPFDNENGENAGKAIVFEYQAGTWTKLFEISGDTTGHFAARTVGISDDGMRAIIGARGYDGPNGPGSGYARVFNLINPPQVPTLSQWGIIILALGFLILGSLAFKKQLYKA